MMEQAVVIRDLNKSYGDFALQNINLSVPRGCIMGLIGENGAGKTTLFKLMLNHIKKESGSIEILGLDTAKEEVQIKEKIGVVFDECCFHEIMTPRTVNGILKRGYRKWDEPLYFQYLSKFSVSADKKIKEFSRGMKMKLSLAAALSHGASILLLDEAMSGLDPVARNEILDIFFEYIQEEQNTILISSHMTDELERIADYITFIHKGTILESSNKDKMLDDYGIAKGEPKQMKAVENDIVGIMKNQFGWEALIHHKIQNRKRHPDMVIDDASLENIMLFCAKGEKQ